MDFKRRVQTAQLTYLDPYPLGDTSVEDVAAVTHSHDQVRLGTFIAVNLQSGAEIEPSLDRFSIVIALDRGNGS